MREMLFKNWKVLFKNTNQTPPKLYKVCAKYRKDKSVCVCGFFFLGFFLKKIFRVLQTRRRVEISKMSESQESNVIF